MVIQLESVNCGICDHQHNGKSVLNDDHGYQENALLTKQVLDFNKKRHEATKHYKGKDKHLRIELISKKSVIQDLQIAGYIVGCAFESLKNKDTIVIPYSTKEYYEKHQR